MNNLNYFFDGGDKMKKIIITLILIITAFTLVGCGNKAGKKAIEDGRAAFEQKEYEKALTFFKVAIDKNTKDEEVKKLYNIIDTYLKGKALYEEEKYSEAKKLLEDLKVDYTKYIIKGDLDELKKNVEEKLTYMEEGNKYIKEVEKYIIEKNPEECKKIIEILEKRELTQEQRLSLEDLKIKLNVLNNELAEENKKDEAIKEPDKGTINESKEEPVKEEENLTGPLDRDKAVKLVKNYLSNNGEYIPSNVVVDGENEKEYIVHCYDVIDNGDGKSHTATSGWYYVNKSTEEITSMF